MPRLSTRAIALRALTAATRRIRQIFLLENFSHLIDGNLTVLNEHNESFLALLQCQRRLTKLRNKRYYSARHIRKYSRHIFEHDLDGDGDAPWLNEVEFMNKYRTSRDGLEHLTNLLKHAPIFKRGKRGPKQLLIKYQVMIWLHFFGHEGMTIRQQ